MNVPLAVGKPILHVVGFAVARCIVDYGYTLHLVKPMASVPDQKEAHLRIADFDCEFDGVRLHFNVGKDRAGLGRALTLFGRTILAAEIGIDASLLVQFDGNITLNVSHHDQFEAWDLDGPDGILIISGPGEKVTVFR